MFTLNSGYVTKRYDGSTDRLILDIYGDVELGALTIKMQVGLGGASTFNSENYVLPITNNVTINVHSGKTTLGQDVALLPGSKVTIDEGATLEIASGYSAFIYDSTEWVGKGCVHAAQDLAPIAYAPSKKFNRATQDANKVFRVSVDGKTYPKLDDCVVDVNGNIIVSGYLYTTNSGAQIISSKGTGSIQYIGLPGTAATTYQYKYTGADNDIKGELINVAVTPAKLMNANGSYTATAGAEEGTIFLYDKTKGIWYSDVTVTYNPNGGSGTL
jgi:hypothetical protein